MASCHAAPQANAVTTVVDLRDKYRPGSSSEDIFEWLRHPDHVYVGRANVYRKKVEVPCAGAVTDADTGAPAPKRRRQEEGAASGLMSRPAAAAGAATKTVYLPVPPSGTDCRWRNPFKVGKDGDLEAVLQKYRDWLAKPENRELYESIPAALGGKVLGCWCVGEHACHAQVLASIADGAKAA